MLRADTVFVCYFIRGFPLRASASNEAEGLSRTKRQRYVARLIALREYFDERFAFSVVAGEDIEDFSALVRNCQAILHRMWEMQSKNGRLRNAHDSSRGPTGCFSPFIRKNRGLITVRFAGNTPIM
jgi:hypothetical protein